MSVPVSGGRSPQDGLADARDLALKRHVSCSKSQLTWQDQDLTSFSSLHAHGTDGPHTLSSVPRQNMGELGLGAQGLLFLIFSCPAARPAAG